MAKLSNDFVWGVATASYQVEGRGTGEKGVCIWDTFSTTGVRHGHNGDRASDQFNRYKEDVQLMKELGVKSYRFSIAWPRIFPDSMEKENVAGFDYYHRLIDELLANGIEPNVTMYHWDLPQYLQDIGGWENREVAYAFEKYAESCLKNLGDKVKMWVTLNEPFCSAYLGYEFGDHAPGLKDINTAYTVVHHLNFAHGLAVKKFRELKCQGQIGIVHNLAYPRSANSTEEDVEAADRGADKGFYMFTDPIFKGVYPQRHLQALDITLPIERGDMDIISEKIDFIGINYYFEDAVTYDADTPEKFRVVSTAQKKTAMGWDVVPDGLYRLIKQVQRNYGDIPLYITENGCACFDTLNEDESRCHDSERVEYYAQHFAQVAKLINEGVNLKGYYAWSFIDNFEWAWGYTRRFGLIYCDYQDMRRIPKDSYYYYREVVAGNEEI